MNKRNENGSPIRLDWRMVLLVLCTFVVTSTFIGLWLPLPITSAADWTSPQNISNATYGAFNPEMTFDSQGYSHVVWYGDAETSDNWAIWYTNNRSGTWLTPKKIASGGSLRYPKIEVDPADGLHVIFEDHNAAEIFYIYSTDYGATWSTKQNISASPGKAYEPSLCTDAEGNVHAVWIDNRWAGGALYQLTYSKRSGGTWSTPVRVQSSIGLNKAPRLVTTGSGADLRIHITFYGKSSDTAPDYEYELYYVRGTGSSWESPRNLSNSPGYASYSPDIARSTSTGLHIVWDETPPGGYHDIYMVNSTDGGSTWSSALHVVTDPNLSRYPAVAYGNPGYVQVVYDDNVSGNGDVFYSYYDPASGYLASPVNLASTSGESKESDVIANACRVGVAWMDKGTVWNVLYVTTPPTPPGPCPGTPTPTVPTATPIPPTPTPTPTPDPRPHGWVNIVAYDPPYSQDYTRQLTVTLYLSATSDIGNEVTEMRMCNLGGCDPMPDWISFTTVFANWPLLATPHNCEYKWVQAWFRDNAGNESVAYSDYILYDNYLTASMSLNGGNPYVNRTLVMVNSVDLDGQQQDCSGLRDMRLREDQPGLTYTLWISFQQDLYFFLQPSGPLTRTVVAQYRDRAGNVGTFSDTITLDVNPPYSGTPPTLNSTTTHLLIPVTGLQAYDDESGVRNVWFANRENGPWYPMPYHVPPYTYTWNLAYGGPPFQAPNLHHIYVKYEDASGYGSLPGNFSPVYSSTISVSGISNIFLPLALRDAGGLATGGVPAPAGTAGLVLLTWPEQAAPGATVHLYLFAPERPDSEFRLRMILPEGLRAVRAWSGYGRVVALEARQVVSQEPPSRQVPFLLVEARVEEGAGRFLPIQGEMSWAGGSRQTAPLWLENRQP